MKKDDEAWFAPKRIGIGAGVPITWQGWAVFAAYVGFALLCGFLMEWDAEVGLPAGIVLLILATIPFILIVKARTRGGWRWRWGGDD